MSIKVFLFRWFGFAQNQDPGYFDKIFSAINVIPTPAAVMTKAGFRIEAKI